MNDKKIKKNKTSKDESGSSTSKVIRMSSFEEKVLHKFAGIGGDFFERIKYKGFSAALIREELAEKEEDEDTRVSDVAYLMAIYISRGTNLHKIADRVDETTALEIKDYIKKYDIPESGKKLSINTITLSRIAAAYPLVALGAIFTSPHFVSPAKDRMPSFIDDVVLTPVFASIIPNDGSVNKTVLTNAHFHFLVEFDLKINPNKPTPLSMLKQYQQATMTGSEFNTMARYKHLVDMQVLVFKNGKHQVKPDYMEQYGNNLVETLYPDRWDKEMKKPF